MNATTRITYLKNELIASQSFHTLGIGTTTLEVIYGQEQIAVEFIVSEMENQEANKMWGQVVSTDRMQIHLVNFRQLMPSKVLGPFDLGTMAGRSMTIVVQVTGVKNTACKFITYSLYMGAENG
ncbi:MAG: DUF6864 domain-containing function [Methylobacter sp.]|jgi:hypothetical protein